jgi:hypothetical protein
LPDISFSSCRYSALFYPPVEVNNDTLLWGSITLYFTQPGTSWNNIACLVVWRIYVYA